MLVKIKEAKYEGADDCGSTAVTDDLFMHSSLLPATKHIQVIKLNYKNSWNLHKTAKLQKRCGPWKKDSMKKVVKSKVVAQKWLWWVG